MNKEIIQEYIKSIELSIEKASLGETKLPKEIFEINGMSANKNRIFLNSLLEMPNVKYFEIGVWKGSTFVSALYGNNPEYAACLDNFSEFAPGKPGYSQEFGDPVSDFYKNIKLIKTKFDFFNAESFSFNKNLFKNKFNVYFYDGKHDHEDQRLALNYYLDSLENDFIFICDDWNSPQVKTGTKEGIEQTKIEIHKSWELPANYNGDKENWWNGLFVAVCSKK